MFDDIRPYNNREAGEVIRRLSRSDSLKAIFEQMGLSFHKEYSEIETIEDMQNVVVRKVINRLIERTIDDVTISGLEVVSKGDGKGRFFISNHRDIALDASLIVWAVDKHKYRRVQVAVGDNLLTSSFVSDLMKLNNCFVVKRGLPRAEQLQASKRLSEYVWQENRKGKYIWMAQRQGRAKDGNDFSNPAILTMLHLSRRGKVPFSEFIKRMNITPVSVSYEYDPCDELKARELWSKEKEGDNYEKEANEDIASIITGVTGYKGRVHIGFNKTLRGEYLTSQEAANEIDRRIISSYKLWPSNLAADNELNGFNHEIDEKDQEKFDQRIAGYAENLRPLLLAMYANPVRNKEKYK